MKFRKKPLMIEAEQWFPGTTIAGVYYDGGEDHLGTIVTPEGTMVVHPGDWIVTGIMGDKHPCNNEIFWLTYEKAE